MTSTKYGAILAVAILRFCTGDSASDRHDESWDSLIFTQRWPTGLCVVDNQVMPGSCTVPPHDSFWAVHGLWPTKTGTKGPVYCRHSGNVSDKFDIAQIQGIQKDLELRWPNLIVNQSVSSLWAHEWVKHGTCAAALPALLGETRYFNSSLQFNRNFDIHKMLSNAGITESSEKSFPYDAFVDAVEKKVGKAVVFYCIRSTQEDRWYVANFHICFDKTLSPIDCAHKKVAAEIPMMERSKSFPSVQPCPHDAQVFYPPVMAVSKMSKTPDEF